MVSAVSVVEGDSVNPSTTYELQAREKKAMALARAIYAEMLRVAGKLNDHEWAILAESLGVKAPSTETQTMVLEILKGKGPKDAS